MKRSWNLNLIGFLLVAASTGALDRGVQAQEKQAVEESIKESAEIVEQHSEEAVSEEVISEEVAVQISPEIEATEEVVSEDVSEQVFPEIEAAEEVISEDVAVQASPEIEAAEEVETSEEVAEETSEEVAEKISEEVSEEIKTPELPNPELDPAEHEILAKRALEVGDFDSAAFNWQRAIAGAPKNLRWGTEYRQAVIAAHAQGKKDAYKDSIDFFERLAEAHADIASVRLNLGYAYVDKIPVEGAITAVILANKALGEFTAALEIEPSWLGYYTRGNSYMYWPAIFGRTELGVSDLEKAFELAQDLPARPYHGRAWAALGDGYWRLEDRQKMRQIWEQGGQRYPGVPELEQRLKREGEELDSWLEEHFETSTRVDTHLRELLEAGDVP